MFVAAFATAWAGDVVFDFTNPTGLTPSVTPVELADGAKQGAGIVVSDNTFTAGGVSISFTNPPNAQESNMAKVWTNTNGSIELRVYKNSSFTISADEAISSVVLTGTYLADISVDGSRLAGGTWTGNSNQIEFKVAGATHKINTITVTLGGGTTDPDPEVPAEAGTLWSEAFDASQGAFTVDNKVMPEALSYVWNWGGASYGMKASAYANQTNYATEAWLVSPVINLTKATETQLTFSHCGNYFADGAIETEVSLMACEAGGAWEKLAIDQYPTGKSWDFVDAKADIAKYAGKKMQFAFVYTSTDAKAGTYEVKNVKILGKGSATVDAPEVAVPVYTSIADLKAAATATNTAVAYEFSNLLVTGVATVNGNTSVYVSDGKDGLLFYGKNETTFRKGEKISGKVSGSLVLYNGLTEISGADYSEAKMVSQNNDVVPTTLTIAQIGTNDGVKTYENMLVKLENVAFTADALSSKNITLVDDSDNEITLRDNFGVLTDFIFDTSKTYNVTAFVSNYKGAPQLYPIAAKDVEMITNLATATTAWEKAEVVIAAGEDWKVENKLTTNSTAKVVYTSSNEAVATVDAEGKITVKGYGMAEITAETAENAEFLASKATFVLYVIEGDGSLEKPYSVADAQYFNGKLEDKVWVKGEIIGCYNNNALETAATKAVATNIAIGTAELNLPVQLPKGAVREALNIVDNGTNFGKTVWIYGNIETYFQMPGVKNVTDYSFDGKTTTGIESAPAAEEKAAAIYSIDGRRLAHPVKGLNIINGKKVFVK